MLRKLRRGVAVLGESGIVSTSRKKVILKVRKNLMKLIAVRRMNKKETAIFI